MIYHQLLDADASHLRPQLGLLSATAATLAQSGRSGRGRGVEAAVPDAVNANDDTEHGFCPPDARLCDQSFTNPANR